MREPRRGCGREWSVILRPAALASVGLAGCNGSPSQNIAGSFFPAWMLCAVLGCGAAFGVRLILRAIRLDRVVFAPPLTYCAVAVAVTLFLWLFQFGQ